MKTNLNLYLIILYSLFLSCPASAWAQETFADRYNISYITMNEGLPNNFIDDIYKDSHGFLWISTQGGGLSRYDGYGFVNFSVSTPHCPLKSNFVYRVFEDRFQRLWVISEGGTDIIDLNTLRPVPLLKGLPHQELAWQPASYILNDTQGYIWLYADKFLHRIELDEQGGIRNVCSLQTNSSFRDAAILCDFDADGKIWMGLNGKLYKVSMDTQGKLSANPITGSFSFKADTYFNDFIIKENELWITTNYGLYRYNKKENIVKHYQHQPHDPYSLSQNYLTDLAITSDKQLIIGSLKGLNVYNPIKDNFERIENEFSHTGTNLLNSNFVNCITVEGNHIWIGTDNGGINKLTTKRLSIQNYRHDPQNNHTLSPNPVNAIYEDREGTLWVGTVEGGLNRKEKGSDSFTHYTYENGILSHNSVSAITTDPQGRLWVGTWGGGINLLDQKNPRHVLMTIFSPSDDNKYPGSFIGALTYDSINNGMWIGTNQGIYFYDLQQSKFILPLPEQVNANIRGCIGSLVDKEGHLWMGCMDGVYIIDLHTRPQSDNNTYFEYRHLKYKLDTPTSRQVEKITCMYQAKDGTLWLGSNGNGIYRRSTDEQGNETFTAYTTQHGLANNSVRGILEDDKGLLWIATYNGISRLHPNTGHITNYTRQDGLADTQFYWNAACNSTEGELYFGHLKGLTSIKYDQPTVPEQPSQVRFTHLLVGNEEIYAGSEQLPQDIAVTREIKIHEKQKSFSLEFSALNFESEHTATYAYRLVGFDSKWIKVPCDRRFASYTNLSPGTYTLQVKYCPDDANSQENLTELKIIIKPYFYKQPWFVLLMTVIALILTWQFYQWRIRNFVKQRELLHQKVEQRTRELNKQKELLEQQTEELSRQNLMLKEQNEKITRQKTQLAKMARKIQGLTLDKIAFFTNITHEFRTPITLIIGPIERALKLSYNPQVIEQLHFVERNSKYLLSLVNQLMDFRKVESGKLEIVKSRHNFQKFADELITPFEVFAKGRNISLKHYYRLPSPEFTYDEEAMHKVLTNLLSNAIKFTPDGGRIALYIAQLPPTDQRGATLYICVSDTGGGIPTEDIDKIFNRFYQSKGQNKYPMYGQTGSGIGLYLCKRIIQMLDGDIHACNNHTVGCSFRILLPIGQEDATAHVAIPSTPSAEAVAKPENASETKKELHILVVEDNADMRAYIRSILRDKYHVSEAANGIEALEVLNAHPVDFIISDLMMPGMDGLELSRRVKANIAISHIPFLMLTAKTSQESRIESYRVGVDDYLLKPFDDTLLLARIENILENRKRYQRKFALNMQVDELNIDEKSGDKKFLNHVMDVMKENYKNPEFEVANFCEAVGVSKTMLNQKLQSLVGQSAGQFIRNYRLNLARDLLLKHRGQKDTSISEIAYEVGFNDPKYFTRCFTKEFNITPRELLNKED